MPYFLQFSNHIFKHYTLHISWSLFPKHLKRDPTLLFSPWFLKVQSLFFLFDIYYALCNIASYFKHFDVWLSICDLNWSLFASNNGYVSFTFICWLTFCQGNYVEGPGNKWVFVQLLNGSTVYTYLLIMKKWDKYKLDFRLEETRLVVLQSAN